MLASLSWPLTGWIGTTPRIDCLEGQHQVGQKAARVMAERQGIWTTRSHLWGPLGDRREAYSQWVGSP